MFVPFSLLIFFYLTSQKCLLTWKDTRESFLCSYTNVSHYMTNADNIRNVQCSVSTAVVIYIHIVGLYMVSIQVTPFPSILYCTSIKFGWITWDKFAVEEAEASSETRPLYTSGLKNTESYASPWVSITLCSHFLVHRFSPKSGLQAQINIVLWDLTKCL